MSWKKWEKAADSGPEALLFKAGCLLVVVVVVFGSCFGVIGWVAGWFGEAAQVVQEQVGPRELLRKYEWFKDAAAQLDAKKAGIKVLDDRLERLRADYGGKSRSEWSREDREQANLWQQEAAGLRLSFNGLAAEYNAQMSKENWRFCEAGRLPAGASSPLPREFRPYEEK